LHQGNIPTTQYELTFKIILMAMADALRKGISEIPSDGPVLVGIGVGAANGNYYTQAILNGLLI
jgi:hypothetical protein